MRFMIRDMLWLMAVTGFGLGWLLAAHRSASLEARLYSAERQALQLKVRAEETASQSPADLATLDALVTALKQSDLSENQRASVRQLFGDELQRHGVKVESHCLSN